MTKEYKNYFFPGQHSCAIPVHSFIMAVPTRWELNKFEKIRNLFRAVMYTLFSILMFLIYYVNWYGIFSLLEYLYSAFFFFSFHVHRTWSHSNKAVQQAVPLIATHINDKTLVLNKKLECNVNISNGLFFFERCSLIYLTVCANKFS